MTEQTFLDAIIADPADDWVRLAYADWLMERGDPRGEFIAVQCALAARQHLCVSNVNVVVRMAEGDKTRCRLKRCEACRLARREWHLWRKHGCNWSAEFYGLIATAEMDTHRRSWSDPPLIPFYRRGFISEVHCAPADWMRHGPALVRACPIGVYRPVGVEPRQPSNGWYEDDIGTELFDACVSLGVKEGYFVSDPWERISRAAVMWARGVDGVNVGQLSTKENER